jgi:isoleucyl-tRNA synthetase
MKFQAGRRRQPIEYEKDLVKYWRDNKIFEKSVDQRPAADSYVFYDGPPFITGVPHHGTLLSSIVKDAVPRYQTMKGKRVERVWGWDCHGLPAEVFTERKLGIKDRRDIGTKISLEEYIKTCRDNMVQTGNEWEDTIARIGRWVDFKGAYKTMDKPYMESVWWAFKKLYDDGKIYEGEKVLLYCTRDATPIAKAEVAMDNSYQDVTDPSVYVKFGLLGDDTSKPPEKYLLGWTTTPWTLPANTAVGVGKDIIYSDVKIGDEILVVAKDLVAKVFVDEQHKPLEYEVLDSYKGEELVGKSYLELDISRDAMCVDDQNGNEYKIWNADYVSTEEGTGIVHLAPAYGEEDYALAKEKGFPAISVIDDNGFYTAGEWKGQLVWDVNKEIAKTLHERGDVWKIDYITHSYPHCHRCGTRLMYRAHPSWFMDVDGQRQLMLEQNGNINWFPEHFKHGRFTKNIQQAPDWNLSRDRFWATALPVWKGKDGQGKEHIKVVGSYAELKELSGVELEDYHRPWIDEVSFEIGGVKYERIDKVMDSWFEAGSMPFAQFHYPFENVEKFEQNFPGDFIAEYVGQVRAWFYYLHAMSVGLFGQNAFKNVIVTGTIAGSDGRKLSKSLGNYTDPNIMMDRYSADAERFTLLNSPLLNGEDFALQDKDVSDVHRKLQMVWNMFDFFTLYASVDGWSFDSAQDKDGKFIIEDPYQDLTHPLDQWIVSRAHQLTAEVTEHMDRYDLPNALKGVLPFIDDASNWYIRRSRKRFWKSDNDKDKDMAYKTLHYVLVRLSLVLAPFTPFMAEELFRGLTGRESVHLCDWPPAGQVNGIVLKEMSDVREVITRGLSQRAEAGIKVRQPLKTVTVPSELNRYADMIREELNVKGITWTKELTAELHFSTKLDIEVNDELKREGLARELIRHIQQARKNAGLNVDDRIELAVTSDSKEINAAYNAHKDEIHHETLATGQLTAEAGHTEQVELDGQTAEIRINKK